MYRYTNEIDDMLAILYRAERSCKNCEAIEQPLMLDVVADNREVPVFERAQPLHNGLPVWSDIEHKLAEAAIQIALRRDLGS